MTKTDMTWLGFLALCLSVGLVLGSYLQKDELLPICHAIAPGLFAPVAVTLPVQDGVFDSQLMLAGQPWAVTFVGPDCDASCEIHLASAGDNLEGDHLVVKWAGSQGPRIAVGHSIAYLQAADSVGLTQATWSQPGFIASWQLNEDHHIERRVLQNRWD